MMDKTLEAVLIVKRDILPSFLLLWEAVYPDIISYPGMKCSQGRIADHKRFTGIQIALT